MNTAVAHYYRMFRGNMGRPAESAFESAKRHINFRKRLGQMVASGDKRSAAAKRGWKKRRVGGG